MHDVATKITADIDAAICSATTSATAGAGDAPTTSSTAAVVVSPNANDVVDQLLSSAAIREPWSFLTQQVSLLLSNNSNNDQCDGRQIQQRFFLSSTSKRQQNIDDGNNNKKKGSGASNVNESDMSAGPSSSTDIDKTPNDRVTMLAKHRRATSSTSSKVGASTTGANKATSVGSRRVGSATRQRLSGISAKNTLMDAVRLKARGAAATAANNNSKNGNSSDVSDARQQNTGSSSGEHSDNNKNASNSSLSFKTLTSSPVLAMSAIHHAIDDMLLQNVRNRELRLMTAAAGASATVALPLPPLLEGRYATERRPVDMRDTSPSLSSFSPPIGPLPLVRDERNLVSSNRINDDSGIIIVPPVVPSSSAALRTSSATKTTAVCVRHATRMDDLAVAQLRLSVFADLTTDVSSQFCVRSCYAMSQRRYRGATCIVAQDQVTRCVVGTAELSYHEFFGTRLGTLRKPLALAYVTEVAVHVTRRKQGIGSLLLHGIDVWAKRQRRRQRFGAINGVTDKNGDGDTASMIETLFLHVDVSNTAAITLYEKAGYRKIDDSTADPIYCEFTKSLNLHPGATQGRNHYLLYKNIRTPTWLEPSSSSQQQQQQQNISYTA